MKICSYQHEEIVYDNYDCPICDDAEKITELEQEKVELEEKIEELESKKGE